MRPIRGTVVAVLVAGVASLGLAAGAHALDACTAAQVISQDPGCPSTGPCSITRVFNVASGCTLDFTGRPVTIAASGKIAIASGSVTLRAGSLTLAAGGLIEGRGTGTTAPTNRGGMMTIVVAGDFVSQRGGTGAGVIDVQGNALGGTILVDAGGSMSIAGRLQAGQLDPSGSGGSITLRAGGDVVTLVGSVFSASGGNLASGGIIDVSAGGRVELNDTISLNGGDGGLLDISAGGEAIIRDIEDSGIGDAGSGGCITISGATGVQFLGRINQKGTTSATGSGGGCGGFFCGEARFGDITVSGMILAEGADPDGGGGAIDLIARGNIRVNTGAVLSSKGIGSMGCGGEVALDAGLDIVSNGPLDGSGGFGGGLIDITAGRDATFTAAVNSTASATGGFGGAVAMAVGTQGRGSLTVGAPVTAGGGGCGPDLGCGAGGLVELSGCDVTLQSTSSVNVRASAAGQVLLTARELLTVQGPIDATSVNPGTGGIEGSVLVNHRTGRTPVLTASILPAPIVTGLGTCTAIGQPACLDPCPTCGDGVVTYPETCDTVGTPVNCDGCSAFCRLENCGDTSACTADTCDPVLGCRHVPVPDGTPCLDATVCNGSEQCIAGTCVPGVPLNCGDGDPCTLDPCDPAAGCGLHPPAPSGTTCNDGSVCTLGDACNGAGACQPGPTPLTCNDGNECTNDSCNPTTGCVFTNRTGPCTDDGNECTNDTCSAGTCTHPVRTGSCTDDGNECTTDVCSGGACTHPARTGTCTDDGNACTTDQCSGGVCVHPPRPNGTVCDDGAFCTINDACQSGVCAGGGPRTCNDNLACTFDFCLELADTCSASPIVPCCGNGAAEAGEDCDDGNASNNDACLTTCTAASCGDGFVRTGVEQCDQGAANADTPNASCRTDCRLQRCGDGILDDQRNEQCDDGGVATGDGCSPRCFLEPPASARLIPGRGNSTTDCAVEWKMDRAALDRLGVPSHKQSCQDGDPACDFGSSPGECTFRVWSCSNNTDSSLPACVPGSALLGTVFRIETSKPSTRDASLRPEDGINRQQLLRAASAGQVATPDACGPRMDVRVPLKTPIRKGSKTLKVKATTTRSVRDSDVLKLFCLPAAP